MRKHPIRINRQTIKDALPDMPESFGLEMRCLIDGMPYKEKEKPMKRKLSAGLVFAIVLMLAALSALAVTVIQSWSDKVADMALDGVFTAWKLEDKALFIDAMREAGLTMDESLYAALSNPELDEAARNDAADQIINDRYGDMMRKEAALWIEPPLTVTGLAPDTLFILRDAYYAENPDATEQEFADYYAYWSRDLGRRYDASMAGVDQDKPIVDEAYAALMTEMGLLDYFSMPENDADKLDTHVEYSAEHQVWICTSSVPKTDIPDRPGNRGASHEGALTDLGDAWEMQTVIDAEGQSWRSRTLEGYLEEMANVSVWNHTSDACEAFARQGVMSAYGLSAAEADRYFITVCDVHKDENRFALATMIFKEHSNGIANDWKYAVMVNAGTGEVMDCVDPAALWARLPEYAEIYPTLTNEERIGYERWLLHGPYNPFGDYENWTQAQQTEWKDILGRYKGKPEWNDLLDRYRVNDDVLPSGTWRFENRGGKPCTMTPLEDGGFLIAGEIKQGNGAADAWAARVNSAGETLWEVHNSEGEYFEAAVAMSDGTFLLAMRPKMGAYFSLTLVALDANGQTLHGPVTLPDQALAAYSGKDCLLIRKNDEGSGVRPYTLLAVNAKGEKLWEHAYDEPFGGHPFPAADGYLLAGMAGDGFIRQQGGCGMMGRLTEQGELLWLSLMDRYPNTGISASVETTDGGMFATGMNFRKYEEDAEPYETSDFVTRFDQDGNVLWCHYYPQSAPPTELRFDALLPAPDDGVVVVAAIRDEYPQNSLHYLLLDRNGDVQAERRQKIANFPIQFINAVTAGGQSYLLCCDDPSYGSFNTYVAPFLWPED